MDVLLLNRCCAGLCVAAALFIGPAVAAEPPPRLSEDAGKHLVDSVGDPLPSGAIARLGTTRWRLSFRFGPIGVTYSPEGELVSWGDSSIRFWDAATGRETGRIGPPDVRRTTSIAFAPGGGTFVRGASGVELWDSAKRKRIWASDAETDHMYAVAYSPEAGLVASASSDRKVEIWAAKDGERRKSYEIVSYISTLAFAPGGKTLAVGDGSGLVHMISPDEDDAPPLLFRAHGHRVSGLAFLDAGRQLLTCGLTGDVSQIRIWDPLTQKMLREFDPAEKISGPCSCAVARDEKLMVSGHTDKIVIWNLQRGELIREIEAPGNYPSANGIAISSDNKSVASGGSQGQIRVWEIDSGKEISPPGDSHLSSITAVRYSPDGRSIATGGMDGAVRMWDAATGKILWRRLQDVAGGGYVRALAFLAGGKVLAIGVHAQDNRGEIRLVDARSGKLLHVAKTKEAINVLSSSPDGVGLAATGPFYGAVDEHGGPRQTANPASVWKLNMTELTESRRWEFADDDLEGLEFLPDGSLVSLERSGELRLSPPRPGDSKLIATLPGTFESFALSRDGKTVLTGNQSRGDMTGKHVAAINLETGETFVKLSTERRRPLGLGISPDGSLAAAYLLAPEAGEGGHHELVLWRLADGKKVLSHIVDEGPGLFTGVLDFSPDGRRVVLGTGRGDALIYDVSEAYGDR